MARDQQKKDALKSELPDIMKAFENLYQSVMSDGALSRNTKELINVGISVALRCEPCIRHHVQQAMKMGLARDEILEAAAVAMLMGGGPSVAYTRKYVLDELDA